MLALSLQNICPLVGALFQWEHSILIRIGVNFKLHAFFFGRNLVKIRASQVCKWSMAAMKMPFLRCNSVYNEIFIRILNSTLLKGMFWLISQEPDNLFLMKSGTLLQCNVSLAVKIHNWHQVSSSWDKPHSTFSIHQGLLDYVTFLGGPSDHPSATQVWNMARTQQKTTCLHWKHTII